MENEEEKVTPEQEPTETTGTEPVAEVATPEETPEVAPESEEVVL